MNKQLKRSLCALSLALFLLPQLPLSVPAAADAYCAAG